MHCLISTLALLSLCQTPPAPAAADPVLEALHRGARQCIDATVKWDIDTLLKLTHPAAIERVGGNERLIELIKRGKNDMHEQGMTFLGGTTEEPKAVFQGTDGLYGLVLTKLQIDTREAVITLPSFLVGYSSDEGKTWVYIDGAPGADSVRVVFPEIPRELKLPEKRQPEFAMKGGLQNDAKAK